MSIEKIKKSISRIEKAEQELMKARNSLESVVKSSLERYVKFIDDNEWMEHHVFTSWRTSYKHITSVDRVTFNKDSVLVWFSYSNGTLNSYDAIKVPDSRFLNEELTDDEFRELFQPYFDAELKRSIKAKESNLQKIREQIKDLEKQRVELERAVENTKHSDNIKD